MHRITESEYNEVIDDIENGLKIRQNADWGVQIIQSVYLRRITRQLEELLQEMKMDRLRKRVREKGIHNG